METGKVNKTCCPPKNKSRVETLDYEVTLNANVNHVQLKEFQTQQYYLKRCFQEQK